MAKILLVEDDKSLREIYGVRLMAEGYEIVSAGDGEEALAAAIKERPDLIVSDVMMPKISGFDMLDILRGTEETRNVKVIMMTALSSEDQRARGESLGADRYLVKSQVGIEDVVRTVHEVLGDAPAASTPAPFAAVATPTPTPQPVPTPAAAVPQPATVGPTPVINQPAPAPVTPAVPAPAPAPIVNAAPQPASTPVPTAEPAAPQPVIDTAPAIAPTALVTDPLATAPVAAPAPAPQPAAAPATDLASRMSQELATGASPTPPAA